MSGTTNRSRRQRRSRPDPVPDDVQVVAERDPPTAEILAVPVATVSAIAGWSRSYTYALLAEGKLEGRKIGRRTVILMDSIRRVLAEAPRVGRVVPRDRSRGVLS